MIHILVPPNRSGLDSFGPKTSQALCEGGVPASFGLLWPERLYGFFNSGRLPFGRRIFRSFVAPRCATKTLQKLEKQDVAWILSFCVPLAKQPRLEAELKSRSANYVFHIMDDWFDFHFLREGTIARCKLADLVGVPTPQLARRVKEFVPDANVAVFEEPIDLDRLKPPPDTGLSETPVVLWCGNPDNLDHIATALAQLRKIRERLPFKLRVVCGQKPGEGFGDGLDVEWKRFDHAAEGRLIAGSWFGLAPMPDTGHNRCKGAYKVKTYLAAGLPVVGSPVGFQADLVREGDGVGFLPRTPDEWEQVLMRLLQDRELCMAMGKRARAYAEKRFSYSVVAPKWAEILRKHFGSSALCENSLRL